MDKKHEELKSIYEEFIDLDIKKREIYERKKELNLKLIKLNAELLSQKEEGSFSIILPREVGYGKFVITKKIIRTLNQDRIIEDFIKLPKEFRRCLEINYKLKLREYRKVLINKLRFDPDDYINEVVRQPTVSFRC